MPPDEVLTPGWGMNSMLPSGTGSPLKRTLPETDRRPVLSAPPQPASNPTTTAVSADPAHRTRCMRVTSLRLPNRIGDAVLRVFTVRAGDGRCCPDHRADYQGRESDSTIIRLFLIRVVGLFACPRLWICAGWAKV